MTVQATPVSPFHKNYQSQLKKDPKKNFRVPEILPLPPRDCIEKSLSHGVHTLNKTLKAKI